MSCCDEYYEMKIKKKLSLDGAVPNFIYICIYMLEYLLFIMLEFNIFNNLLCFLLIYLNYMSFN